MADDTFHIRTVRAHNKMELMWEVVDESPIIIPMITDDGVTDTYIDWLKVEIVVHQCVDALCQIPIVTTDWDIHYSIVGSTARYEPALFSNKPSLIRQPINLLPPDCWTLIEKHLVPELLEVAKQQIEPGRNLSGPH